MMSERKNNLMFKDDKGKFKLIPLLIGLGIVLIVVLIFFLINNRAENTFENIQSIQDLEREISIDSRIRATYQPDRSSYGLGTVRNQSFNLQEIFTELPSLPEDFYRYKYLSMTGRMDAEMLCAITQDYYLQPEFYRNNFVDVGLRRYKEPSETHWTPEGYGNYPHQMEVLTSPGESFTLCTFFHTAWGVESYQGFSIVPVYPSKASVEGIEQDVDSEASKRYISLTATPSEVLLEPAYLIFKEGWVQPIKLFVSVSNDAPPGIYAVGFDVGRASMESSSEWQRLYAEKYQGKSSLHLSVPQFIAVIKVRGDGG